MNKKLSLRGSQKPFHTVITVFPDCLLVVGIATGRRDTEGENLRSCVDAASGEAIPEVAVLDRFVDSFAVTPAVLVSSNIYLFNCTDSL